MNLRSSLVWVFFVVLTAATSSLWACKGDKGDGQGTGEEGETGCREGERARCYCPNGLRSTGICQADQSVSSCECSRAGVEEACPALLTANPRPPTQLSDGEGNNRPARLVIEAVDFANDRVLIRNVSDEEIVFTPTSDVLPWKVHLRGSNALFLPHNYRMAPGQRVTIHLRAAGRNNDENIYLNWVNNDDADLQPNVSGRVRGGEFAILSAPAEGEEYGSNPRIMEAFVRWGRNPQPGSTATHMDEAQAAGLWPTTEGNTFVQVSDGDVGLVVNGFTNSPRSWHGLTSCDAPATPSVPAPTGGGATEPPGPAQPPTQP